MFIFALLVMSSPYIRKRRDLNLKQKIDLLKKYDALPQMPQQEVATKLDISQSALSQLLKNRHKVEEDAVNNENNWPEEKKNR